MKGVFLDIETSGIDCDLHVALEIGLSIYDLHNMECLCGYYSFIKCSEREFVFGSDPKSLKINGITLNDVLNAKDPTDVKNDIIDLFVMYGITKTSSVFICQNPSFDRMFFPQIIPIETQQELELPYHWLDLASMYFARSFDSIDNPIKPHDDSTPIKLSKDSIAKHLGIPPEQKPHRAFNGVQHLIACYKALFKIQ